MFNITRQDLAQKTDAQLSFLFHEAQNTTPRIKNLCHIFKAAQVVLVLIRQEISARKLSLK